MTVEQDEDEDEGGEYEEGDNEVDVDEDDEESDMDEMKLDEDGRVPAGILPENPRPPLLNYGFRTWRHFLAADDEDSLKALQKDAKSVCSARSTRSGESYSAGETFFLPAAMTPRCGLENLARIIFDTHTKGLVPNEDYDVNLSGAEWWTLVLEKNDDVGFHWDRDYALEDDGIHVHPHVATVTYLASTGAPTVVASVVGTMEAGRYDSLCGPVQEAWLSQPLTGKHISFDGRMLHGSPAEANVWGGQPPRITFLVNVWLNHKPLSSDACPPAVIEKLAKFQPLVPDKLEEAEVAEILAADLESYTVLRLDVRAEESVKGELELPMPLQSLKSASAAGGSYHLRFSAGSGGVGACTLRRAAGAGPPPAKRPRGGS